MIKDKNNVDKNGVKFNSANPLQNVRLVAKPELTADRVLTLPDETGTVATQEYVAANSGGTTWDDELTIASPIVVGTTDTEITDFTVAAMPYGLYEFELAIMVRAGAAG